MDSSYFQTRYSPDPGRARVWKAVTEYLQKFIQPDSAVLDFGAGYCDFINQVRAARRFAADANPQVADSCAPGVEFVRVHPENLPELADASLDVVFASNLLEHLTDQERNALFDRFDRWLRRPGRIILIQPNYHYCYRQYWDDFTHVKAFSDVSLGDFVRSRGYRIERVERRFLPFSFKSTLPKSYWITKCYLASFWRPMAKQMLIVAQR